jgi:hypothetical protein
MVLPKYEYTHIQYSSLLATDIDQQFFNVYIILKSDILVLTSSHNA